MIREFEIYHGAALRKLIVGSTQPVKIEAFKKIDRANTYVIDDHTGVHLKHSSKRLPPWQFTYLDENLSEIEHLARHCNSVWLIHVCGQDGVVALSLSEFWSINPRGSETTCFVRVDRDRNTMYRVNGTGSKLSRPKRGGLRYILDEMQDPK